VGTAVAGVLTSGNRADSFYLRLSSGAPSEPTGEFVPNILYCRSFQDIYTLRRLQRYAFLVGSKSLTHKQD